mmetsp:Transcript_114119/g.368675  ORF Transcript_114119/g.368675 Transcript_114119/m.368675 type:complete len:343 (-) Transcript_114119:612-1640(-)
MRGRQRRRAGSVAYEVRPLHVEDKAEAVGDDGQHRAGASTRGAYLHLLGDPAPVQLVVAHGAACVYGLAVGDLLGEADHGQALGACLQHEPLHRVHARGFGVGDLEVLVVKHVHALAVGLVLGGGLPALVRLLVGRPIRVHVPPGHGHLDHGVRGRHQRGVVRPLAVHEAWEPRHGVHHMDVLRPRRWRRALADLREPAGVALHVGEVELRSLGEEVGHEEERLLGGLARVLVDVRPKQDDGVGSGRDGDVVHDLGEARNLGAVLHVQGDLCRSGAAEVHGPQQRTPPCLEECAQGSVVGLWIRKLWLLVLRQGQADQAGRALVDCLLQHVEGVGLEGRRDV